MNRSKGIAIVDDGLRSAPAQVPQPSAIVIIDRPTTEGSAETYAINSANTLLEHLQIIEADAVASDWR